MRSSLPVLAFAIVLSLFGHGEARAAAGVRAVDCASLTQISQGLAADCGYLSVPENRARPDSRRIEIPFVRLHSTSAHPAADPVIIMSGGPGNQTIGGHVGGDRGVLASRDYILFEQRGTHRALPALECPEYVAARLEQAKGRLAGAAAPRALSNAARACARRARAQGADLRGYTSVEIAADIEELRQALALPALNLYGLSYSGRVMMTYARDYPATTRSVVLNSPLPIEANYDEQGSANVRRTLDMVFDGCAVDTACHAAFPDPRGQFLALVRGADARPLRLTLPDPEHPGQSSTIRVDGRGMADALLNNLYSAKGIETLPATIDRVSRGGGAALAPLMDISPSRYTWLMRISVWCNEEYPFEHAGAIRAQATDYPEFGGLDQSTVPPGVCAAAGFGDVHPDPRENQPVQTDIPVLIVSGEMDSSIPTPWTQEMLAHLPHGRLLVVPGAVHGAGFDPCPDAIIAGFFDHPDQPPDTSCLTTLKGADFMGKGDS